MACLHADAEKLEEALLCRPEGLPHLLAGGVGVCQSINQLGSQVLHHGRLNLDLPAAAGDL